MLKESKSKHETFEVNKEKQKMKTPLKDLLEVLGNEECIGIVIDDYYHLDESCPLNKLISLYKKDFS